jgi:hypothetical protein
VRSCRFGAYSYRPPVDFGAPRDYLAALGRNRKPEALPVGGTDELFYPDSFAPWLRTVRFDLPITIVPGIGHIGMTVAPDGTAPASGGSWKSRSNPRVAGSCRPNTEDRDIRRLLGRVQLTPTRLFALSQ